MYFFNRQPVSPYWKRRYPTKAAVSDYLGLDKGGTGSILRHSWSKVKRNSPFDGWHLWRARGTGRRPRKAKASYKVYVSPNCGYVREAFQATLEVISTGLAHSVKVGDDVYGLLRPDKIVVYCNSLEEVQEIGDSLFNKLAGCPVHGVPFTAELGKDGLLSWGVDPPRTEQVLDWQERQSWRLWITNRLAAALLTARAGKAQDIEPWRFALERLELEGVDTTTWTPRGNIWGSTFQPKDQ